MRLFLSTFTNKVDSKGRVSVPATFRAVLDKKDENKNEEPFKGIIVFPSEADGHRFLVGCSADFLERLSAGMETLPTFSAEQEMMGHLIFAACSQLPYDQTGRVMLTRDLLEATGITDQARFVGLGKTFQLWEPSAYDAHLAALKASTGGKRPSAPALFEVPPPGGSR